MTTSKETITRDFRRSMDGFLDPSDIDAIVEALLAISTKHPAQGSIIPTPMMTSFRLKIAMNWLEFLGNSHLASVQGGGRLVGNVCTDDPEQLTINTERFTLHASSEYLCTCFLDGDMKLLGYFLSEGASVLQGMGEGEGCWS